MAKRKIECDLNDIIGVHLRKKKCEKSLKLFYEKSGEIRNDKTKIWEKFLDYLKEKNTAKKHVIEEDLGFEINFGAYQPDIKVSSNALAASKRFNNEHSKKKQSNIEGEIKKKKEIPKEFVKKILRAS